VVLTRTGAIRTLSNVTIAPITRTIRGIKTEVALTPADGVPTRCAVSLDNIITIPKILLDKQITALSAGKMLQIFAAVRAAFEMPP
jgi:mRNA interferase MazF